MFTDLRNSTLWTNAEALRAAVLLEDDIDVLHILREAAQMAEAHAAGTVDLAGLRLDQMIATRGDKSAA